MHDLINDLTNDSTYALYVSLQSVEEYWDPVARNFQCLGQDAVSSVFWPKY